MEGLCALTDSDVIFLVTCYFFADCSDGACRISGMRIF